MSDPQVVVVNRRTESEQRQEESQVERVVGELKLTNNLIKEISFNSTVNRFEYLEQLLRKEHDQFIATVSQAINQQREVIKQMKNLQKQIREMKMPVLNFARLVAHSQDLLKLKQESDKNCKLSAGMLMALGKIEKELDSYEQRGKGKEREEAILM